MRRSVILALILVILALCLTACYRTKPKDNNLERRKYMNNGFVAAFPCERSDILAS